MKKAAQFLVILLCCSFFCKAQKEGHAYLLIGTFTMGKSEGIYVYEFNYSNGSCTFKTLTKTSNPGFLAVAPNKKFVYAVYQPSDSTRLTTLGHVAAFSFNKEDGSLQFINKQSSEGKNPCHVSIDSTGKWLSVANYFSGNFSILPIQPDGSLGVAKQTIQHEGKGKDEKRQAGPHAHQSIFTPDNKSLIVQDLGIDKLMAYRFDEATGNVTTAELPSIQTEAGAGPRHIDLHPKQKIIYVAEELSNTVSVWTKKSIEGTSSWVQEQRISAVPTGYDGPSGTADIHISPDGKFLYVSNRGTSNTIGIFSVDDKTGKLKLVAHQSTMGKTPRNFTLDPTGNFLLVANQESDNIIVFKRDTKTGMLASTGYSINVGNPTCLKWITR